METLAVLQKNDGPDNHWQNYTESIQIVSVPGNHASDPHVQVLVQQLHKATIRLDTYKAINTKKMVDINTALCYNALFTIV